MIRPTVLLGISLALSGAIGLLGETSQEIPSHPRQLQFEQEQQRLPTVEGRRHELKSGAVVYVVEDHTLPLVEIGLATRAGSYLDPPKKTGLASLTATQLRRGGSRELGPDEFDDRVDDLGALLDSQAGGSRAGARLSVPSWSFSDSLDLFFDMISKPAFNSARLENAHTSYLESLTRRNENPLDIMQREWGWLLYGKTHFTTRPWTPDTLQAIDRDSVINFHREFWKPERMILAVSGDVTTSTLLELLEARFSAWPSSSGSPAARWPPEPPGPGVPPGLYHYEFDAPQAKIILGHRLSGLLDWQDNDRFILAVVAEILGGKGAVSRIGGRLRTAEGLVYRVGLDLEPGDFWPGKLEVFFETRSDSVARAIDLTIEEIERLRSEPPHPDELAVAKRTLVARIGLEFDTAEEIAGYFAGDEFLGRPHTYWQSYLDGVQNVTPDQVRQAANKFLVPDRLVYLVVGRWSEISGRSSDGRSSLEESIGFPVSHLPQRDPSTLEALGTVAADENAGNPRSL